MAKERFTFRADASLLSAVDSLIGTRGEDRTAVVVTLLRDGVIGAIGGNASDGSVEKLATLETILTDIQTRLTSIEQAATHQSRLKKHSAVKPPSPIEPDTVALKSNAAKMSGYPGETGGLSPWVKRRGFESSDSWLEEQGWRREGKGYNWRYVGLTQSHG